MNVEVDAEIYESQHRHEIHEMLSEKNQNPKKITVQCILTFRDHEEAEEHKAIAMCSSEVVVYVADR